MRAPHKYRAPANVNRCPRTHNRMAKPRPHPPQERKSHSTARRRSCAPHRPSRASLRPPPPALRAILRGAPHLAGSGGEGGAQPPHCASSSRRCSGGERESHPSTPAHSSSPGSGLEQRTWYQPTIGFPRFFSGRPIRSSPASIGSPHTRQQERSVFALSTQHTAACRFELVPQPACCSVWLPSAS